MAIIKADANNFLENISSGLVLVDFYADWCGPCKMLAPVLEEVSKEMEGLTIVKLNVDDVPTIANQYGIRSIPTIILFKNGNKVAQSMGFQPKEMLTAWIDQNK